MRGISCYICGWSPSETGRVVWLCPLKQWFNSLPLTMMVRTSMTDAIASMNVNNVNQYCQSPQTPGSHVVLRARTVAVFCRDVCTYGSIF